MAATKPVEPKIGKGLRFRILARDHFRCVYCGASAHDGARLHVDHVRPRSQGGTNDPSNLVTACSDCNLGKSDTTQWSES
ncbi:MAG TPA: HNH endonuclease [Candidatus Saccharimonadia bacterium]|nr:HNH endonuclease [Candidatus Saccharimonadia bacterium]